MAQYFRFGCPVTPRLGTEPPPSSANADLGLPDWVTDAQRKLLVRLADTKPVFIINAFGPADVLSWLQAEVEPLLMHPAVRAKFPDRTEEKLWYEVAKNLDFPTDRVVVAGNIWGSGTKAKVKATGTWFTDDTATTTNVSYPLLVYVPPSFVTGLATVDGQFGTGALSAPEATPALFFPRDPGSRYARKRVGVEDNQSNSLKAALDDAQAAVTLRQRGAAAASSGDAAAQYGDALSQEALDLLAEIDARLAEGETREAVQTAQQNAAAEGAAAIQAQRDRLQQELELAAAQRAYQSSQGLSLTSPVVLGVAALGAFLLLRNR